MKARRLDMELLDGTIKVERTGLSVLLAILLRILPI